MDNKLKYFLFNKQLDYKRGFLDNIQCDENGISVEKCNFNKAVFISRVLDSQEPFMEWHRLTINKSNKLGIAFKISIYAGENTVVNVDNEFVDISDVIHSNKYSLEQKQAILEPYFKLRVDDTTDILLHNVVGRYLWIIIEMYSKSNIQTYLSDIKIMFPRKSWIEYLPEVYQEADYEEKFLERYLGIFQTLYEDLNKKIEDISWQFDINSISKEQLDQLATWIGIDNGYMWSKDKLQEFLLCAVKMYKRRGTRQGIIDFIELYTGEKPYIVEYFDIQKYKNNLQYYKKLVWLYGDNPFVFTIIMRKQAVPTVQMRKSLVKIIDEIKPAEMGVNLVILKPYIILDGYSYLGINSELGAISNITLKEGQALSLTKL